MSKNQTIRRFVTIFQQRIANNRLQDARYLTPIHNLTFNNQIRYNQTNSRKCWKCGVDRRNITELFCESCKVIQEPHEKLNYFKVMNVNADFDINTKDLVQSYRKMQSVLHPDKFSNCSEEEKEISAEYSSLVNKAFNTLQTPLSRALHMLKLNNESIGEDNKSDDPEFLMEVMELNEEIDEADTPEKLKALELKNKEMLGNVVKVISEHFKQNDIQSAKKAIIKMKYYNSVSKRISDLLRERGIVD